MVGVSTCRFFNDHDPGKINALFRTACYRRLADIISTKQDKPYSLVVSWLRTRLSYASLHAAVLCIRGSRSSHHHPIFEHDLTLAIFEHDLTLATAEGKIPPSLTTASNFFSIKRSSKVFEVRDPIIWILTYL